MLRFICFVTAVAVVLGCAPAVADEVDSTLDRAQESLFAGELDRARDLALDIWLSSAPNEARERAWRIMFLAESEPALPLEGHLVWLEAPGGRDHPRFSRWIREAFVESYDWILDFQIRYVPTLVSDGRAGETAFITFGLDEPAREPELLALLARTSQDYRTDQWLVIHKEPLHAP